MLYASLKELDAEGKVKEGGIEKTTTLRIDLIEDEEIKKSLIGLKKGDVVQIDLKKGFADSAARLLEVTEEELESVGNNFELTVENINRLEEADLDKEFFDKVFGEDVIKTEEEFQNRVKEEVEEMFVQNSSQRLQKDIYDFAMEKVNISLPDEFLKKWLKSTNENLTEEELAEGYEDFATNLKWTLIENKVLTDNDLEIKYEEVFQTAKEKLASQLKLYGQASFTEEQLSQYAAQLLQDKEQANRIFEEVKALKVFNHIKEKSKIETKEIENSEFIKLD